jgi:hypothetical protein
VFGTGGRLSLFWERCRARRRPEEVGTQGEGDDGPSNVAAAPGQTVLEVEMVSPASPASTTLLTTVENPMKSSGKD